jgi:hypothetical protein
LIGCPQYSPSLWQASAGSFIRSVYTPSYLGAVIISIELASGECLSCRWKVCAYGRRWHDFCLSGAGCYFWGIAMTGLLEACNSLADDAVAPARAKPGAGASIEPDDARSVIQLVILVIKRICFVCHPSISLCSSPFLSTTGTVDTPQSGALRWFFVKRRQVREMEEEQSGIPALLLRPPQHRIPESLLCNLIPRDLKRTGRRMLHNVEQMLWRCSLVLGRLGVDKSKRIPSQYCLNHRCLSHADNKYAAAFSPPNPQT